MFVPFFFYLIFFSGNIFNCSEEFFVKLSSCELVIRVELQGSYLEKPSGTSGDFSTLISHNLLYDSIQ